MSTLGKWLKILGSGVLLLAAMSAYGASQTMDVEYSLGKVVRAVWSGGDGVSAGGGDGRVVLEPGVAKTAMLNVACNSTAGYAVRFTTPNATSDMESRMLLEGVGGADDREISYTTALDVEDFRSAATIVTEALNLQGGVDSLVVKFDGSTDVLPIDPTAANAVKLLMTLATFDPYTKQEGLYRDTLTAEVTVR